MRHMKTLATRITKKTYPIAAACLPPGFSTFPFSSVAGRWLIINRIGMEVNGEKAMSVIDNLWIEESDFKHEYKIVRKNVVGPFHEIEPTE